MATEVTYAIPVTSGVYEINISNFIPRSVIIENHAGDSVLFDNTVDPLLVIPPGVSVPINIYHLVYTLRFRTNTNTTGYVRATISDSQRDISNAPVLQQLPGGISITQSGPLSVSGNVTDTPVETNTAGLTSSFLSPITPIHATAVRWTPARAFSMVVVLPGNVRTDGILTVSVQSPDGSVFYRLIDQVFLQVSVQGVSPTLPFVYRDNFPSNFIINVAFTGDADFQVGY